jgi:hypothetical protein
MVDQVLAPTMEFDAAGAHAFHAEHQRLQSAVVEAAKVYLRNRGYGPAERSLMASVDALIAFEAEHKIGEG